MEATIKQDLLLFLNCQISAESLSSIDDIVLGYIVSVLEQLGEDEQFDVDEFAEIMDAYIPGFDTVNREDVCRWMIGLAEKLVYTRTSSNNHMEEDNLLTKTNNVSVPSSLIGNDSVYKCVSEDTKNPSIGIVPSSSSETTTGSLDCKSRCQDQEATAKNPESIGGERNESASYSEGVSVLEEMFPDACSLDIEHCLIIANGDTETAVQMMLLKNERNDTEEKEDDHDILKFSPKIHCPSAKRQELEETEQQFLKSQLMARYGYVDVSQDEKTHQPILHTCKQENKKLVRYRDNQVVSNKGERFSWVKREETEDMKKTYVNLKPARKYRFH